MDRKALDEILRIPEGGLFLRRVTERIGFQSCTIPHKPRPCASGKPGYSLAKMLGLAVRGVCAFSVMPLRIGICIGFAGSVLSAAGVAVWFVFAMAGLGGLLAKPFKMRVGHVIKHDAARRAEKPGLAFAQPASVALRCAKSASPRW